MGKKEDIEDILGDGKATKGSKKADKPAKTEKPAKADKKAAKPAKEEKPAKKADKPAKAAKAEKPAKEEKAARVREPVEFEDGEKEALSKKVLKAVTKAGKGGIVSKDLAATLEIKTRKLRAVAYSMERAGEIKLKPGASRAAGMTLLPA